MNENGEVYKNRDMILGEIHENTRNTEKSLKIIDDWCKEHDKKDDKRFLLGAVALIVVAFASGVLPELLKLVRLG